MTRRGLLFPWVLLVLSMIAACSNSPSSLKPGATGSTAGQQCERIMNAYCARAVNDCLASGTVADCVSTGTSACCLNKCNSTAISSEASIDTCVSAMSTITCVDVTAQNIPAVCKGAVKAASFTPVIREESIGAQLSSATE